MADGYIVEQTFIPNVDPLSPDEIDSAGADRTPGHQIPSGTLRGVLAPKLMGVGYNGSQSNVSVAASTGVGDILAYIYFTHNLGMVAPTLVSGDMLVNGTRTYFTSLTNGQFVSIEHIDLNNIRIGLYKDGTYVSLWNIQVNCLVLTT